jgi:uncharacterized protein (DUF488 family)
MQNPFFTIGHSTRSVDAFIDLLRTAGVRLVVDVRTIPRSRRVPQFNGEALALALGERGIGYERIRELGGLRGRRRDVPADVNAMWKNDSFHNYADYALGDAFRSGLARLRELGHARTCACMCAEAVWWRCHRRIIADHLLAAGEAVFHIMGGDRIEPARLTAGARVAAGGVVTYPQADEADEARKVQRAAK